MTKRPGLLARYRRVLKNDAAAGIVLMIAAAAALVWSNSPWREAYERLATTVVGPGSVHLALPIEHWASDGILTVFFFVVGLELKQEFTLGSLRDPRKAAVPIIAAACGMAGPSAFYALTQVAAGSGEYGGWAVPVATDIAFALAILAIFGRGLPPAARTFLMTLAVADDLGGIIVIAVFFAGGVNFGWLGGAIALVAAFGFLTAKRITHWWFLWPLAVLAWYCMHMSGVHATIAGVALGMVVPTGQRKSEPEPMTHRFTEKLSFASNGAVLPIFAFFAAGVDIVDSGGFGKMLTDPVSVGIYLGLPVGKCIGIFGGVWIMTRFLRLRLGAGVDLADIFPISLVAGIGFTVSLLIAQLSFPADSPHEPHSRVAVIFGTLLSILLGAIALRRRLSHPVRGPKGQPGMRHDDQMRHSPDQGRRSSFHGDMRGRHNPDGSRSSAGPREARGAADPHGSPHADGPSDAPHGPDKRGPAGSDGHGRRPRRPSDTDV